MIRIIEQGEGNLSEGGESTAERLRQSPFWGKSVTKAPSFDEFVAGQKTKMNPEQLTDWDEGKQAELYTFYLQRLNEEKIAREALYSAYVRHTLQVERKESYLPFEVFEAMNYGIKENDVAEDFKLPDAI